MYCEEPTQIVDQKPATTLRCLKMRGGISAVLGSNIWTATKAISSTAMRVNNAIIRPLFHYRLSIHRNIKIMVRLTHSIRLATPLKCQQKTYHARYQYYSTEGVKLRQLLRPGELGCISVGNIETECNCHHRHSTKGQINVKAPPPRYIRGKGTTNQGSHNRRNAK
jgi:hypothetical protein